MGRIVPYIMENKTCSKPPTSKSWLNRQSFGLKHQKIGFWTTNLIWLWIKNLADEHEDSYLASIDVHSWNYDTRGCDPSSMPTKYIPDLSKQGKHHSWKLFSYKYAAFQLELSRRRNNRVWRVKWPITSSVEGSISSWLGLLNLSNSSGWFFSLSETAASDILFIIAFWWFWLNLTLSIFVHFCDYDETFSIVKPRFSPDWDLHSILCFPAENPRLFIIFRKQQPTILEPTSCPTQRS